MRYENQRRNLVTSRDRVGKHKEKAGEREKVT